MVSSTFACLDWIGLLTVNFSFRLSHTLHTQSNTYICTYTTDNVTDTTSSTKLSFMDNAAADDLSHYFETNEEEHCECDVVEDFDDSEAFEYVTQLPT